MTRKELDTLLAAHGLQVDDVEDRDYQKEPGYADVHIGIGAPTSKLCEMMAIIAEHIGMEQVHLNHVSNDEHLEYGAMMLTIKRFWNA